MHENMMEADEQEMETDEQMMEADGREIEADEQGADMAKQRVVASEKNTVASGEKANVFGEKAGASKQCQEPSTADVEAAEHPCGCRHKATPRSSQMQKDIQRRLNRAIGQLNGVKAMVDDNRYCGDVLTQLAAAESAVRRVSEIVLQEHMKTCVIDEIRSGNNEVVDEVLTLMRRFF